MSEPMNKTDHTFLKKLNKRALKLYEIHEYFIKKKVGIDMAYLDTLDDEEVNNIHQKCVINGPK